MVDTSNSQVTIEQTVDGREIGSIWLKDDIFERTADAKVKEAGKDVVQIILDRVEKDDDHIFLSVKAEDKLIGIVSTHPFRDGYEIHPIILDEYRIKYAHVAIGRAIEWVYKHKDTEIVYTQIPALYKAMLNFAMKRGFEVVEIIKGGRHHNNGNHYDLWVLALEKSKCQV